MSGSTPSSPPSTHSNNLSISAPNTINRCSEDPVLALQESDTNPTRQGHSSILRRAIASGSNICCSCFSRFSKSTTCGCRVSMSVGAFSSAAESRNFFKLLLCRRWSLSTVSNKPRFGSFRCCRQSPAGCPLNQLKSCHLAVTAGDISALHSPAFIAARHQATALVTNNEASQWMVLGFAVGTYEAVRMAFIVFLDLIKIARKLDVLLQMVTRQPLGDSHY